MAVVLFFRGKIVIDFFDRFDGSIQVFFSNNFKIAKHRQMIRYGQHNISGSLVMTGYNGSVS